MIDVLFGGFLLLLIVLFALGLLMVSQCPAMQARKSRLRKVPSIYDDGRGAA